jgi:hypothetical protein
MDSSAVDVGDHIQQSPAVPKRQSPFAQPAASAVLASEAASLKSNSKTKTYILLASLSLLPKVLEKSALLAVVKFSIVCWRT